MRPTDDSDGRLYECFRCGIRKLRPDSRVCPVCDGRLQNIGAARDR